MWHNVADGNTLYQKRMKGIAIFSSNVPADYDMESPDFPFRRPGRQWKRCGLSATRSESAVSEKEMGRCGGRGPVVWPNGRIAVFSYDRLHIPHDGGSGVLFRAVKSTPNRPHATCSEPHFPALPEKAESLVNFLFTRLSALIFAVRRGLAPPLHTLLWLSRPFLRSAFWYTELATTSLRRISQSFWAFFWDRSMKISFNVQKFKE